MKELNIFLLNVSCTLVLAIVFWVVFYPLASLPWFVAMFLNCVPVIIILRKKQQEGKQQNCLT